ncbi:hypothetical protein ADUPG1_009270, partial [Aduncisulcus paluster]
MKIEDPIVFIEKLDSRLCSTVKKSSIIQCKICKWSSSPKNLDIHLSPTGYFDSLGAHASCEGCHCIDFSSLSSPISSSNEHFCPHAEHDRHILHDRHDHSAHCSDTLSTHNNHSIVSKDKKLETDGEGSPSSSSHVEAPIKLECHISATSCMLPCLCHHHSPSFRSIDIKTSISDGHLSNPSNIVIFPDSSHSRNPQEQEDADKKHDISSISGSLLLPFRYVIAAWLLREKQVSLVIAHGQTKSISESSHADICKEVKEEEGDMK